MEQHLTDQQIDALLQIGDNRIGEAARKSDEGDAAKVHLQTCESCSTRLREQELAMEQLDRLKTEVPAGSRPQCPPAGWWLEVVAGLRPQETERLLNHAIQCDYCGPLLREAASDLADEISPELEERIARLRTSLPSAQQDLAASLRDACGHLQAKAAPKPLRWTLGGIRFAWPAMAFALAAIVAWLGFRYMQSRSPQTLVEQAYTEKRTVELRMEGFAYSPLVQNRGDASRDRMTRPSLLQAEAEIANHLRAQTENVAWLQASGRIGLLDGDKDAVERSLADLLKAHQLDPDNVSLTIDMASAYFQRGKLERRHEDIARAADWLGVVLKKAPDNEVAQFNYAVALENLNLKQDAIVAWQTFLQMHPASSWAAEARKRMQDVSAAVHAHNQRSNERLFTAEELQSKFASGHAQDLQTIDERIEDYQDIAIREWLPVYYAPASEGGQPNAARAAIAGIAQLLKQRHGETWLIDMTAASGQSLSFARAASMLAQSEELIERSDDRGAQAAAQSAAELFARAHIPAGVVRARLSLAYIFQMQHQESSCEALSGALAKDLRGSGYVWEQVQNDLEQAACATTCDRRELELARQAETAARQHGFADLAIRASNFIAASYQVMGDRHLAWREAAQAMEQFWQGGYAPRRGYNLLTNLDNLAEDQDLWFLERAVLQEEGAPATADPSDSIRAVAVGRLGEAQLRGGDVSAAEHSFRLAQQMFTQVPPGIRREALRVEMEVDLAEAELQSQLPSNAFLRLNSIREEIARIPDQDLQLEFYQTSGIAALRDGRLREARSDLQTSVQLAENGLNLAKSEAGRWKWRSRNEAEYRTLVELDLKSDPDQAFRNWELYKGASLRSGQNGRSERFSAAPAEAGIPPLNPDTVLVSYFISSRMIAAWVGDGEQMRIVFLPVSPERLSLQVRRFADLCSDPSSSAQAIGNEGAALYNQLILPFESLLSGRREIIIEPDGILRKIPFEVLMTGNHAYFGDRFALVISPGTEYLKRMGNWPGISRTSEAFILGNPAIPGWISLPEAEQEAREIATLFQAPRLLLDQPQSDADLAVAIARARIFHFSGHATASAEYSGLTVGDSSNVAPFNFDPSGPVATRLVVLSACSSALGTEGHFDDEDSMVRRLIAARVPFVVASRWAVDSTATAVLMKAFYASLFDGNNVSRSLAAAQRQVRVQSQFSHPYYWAAFSVFGQG